MNRQPRRRTRKFDRGFGTWLQRWSQIPKYNNADLLNHIRKLLIYYPKDPQSLKSLPSLINNRKFYKKPVESVEAENLPEIMKLYQRIVTRYKK